MEEKMQSGKNTLPMGRSNIVFFGLMAFQEWGAHYKVLIPDPQGTPHRALFGNPFAASKVTEPIGGLRPFNQRSDYRVDGLNCQALSCQPPPHTNIILQNSMLEVQPEYVHVTIWVPKPNMIRGHRAVEIRGTALSDIAIGDPSHWALFRQPDLLHEVTVFSYFTSPDAVGPTLLQNGDEKPQWKFRGASSTRNLCVYSAMEDAAMKERMSMRDEHSKLLNAMFKVRSRSSALDPLNLKLYMQADHAQIADGSPIEIPKSVGIKPLELWSLAELTHSENLSLLEKQPNGDFNTKCSDPSGCGAVFLIDYPGTY